MEHLIRRCAELHLEHIRISGDPFECGRTRPLDFGHWSAHKMEVMSKYRIRHGQAVAIGVTLDSCYAAQKGWITKHEFEAIHQGLARSGFLLWCKELEYRDKNGSLQIMKGLQDFQEHLGGELCVTFPRGIGNKFEVHEIDPAMVEKAVQELKVRGCKP